MLCNYFRRANGGTLVTLLLTFFFGFSVVSNAQSCPSVKRNNGNNAAHTEYALSVMNTSYTSVPTSSKEGTITVNFGSTFPSASVPVIEGVYVGGTRLNVDFGPPSDPDDDNQHDVEYCFYGTNLPPAKTFTVRFLNPSDSSVWSECTFPKLSGSNETSINVASDIENNAVCSGESITWNVSATAANGQNLRYQWYKDGTAISGKTSSSLTVSNFATSDAGTYYCIVEEYKNNTTNWSYQTSSGTLSLSNCANLEITRIQSPEEVSISGSNDLSVEFDVEFNQGVNTPATTDFSAILDLSSSRTISSVSSVSGSSKRYTVVVDIQDEDEGQLALTVASSNSITSTSGSLSLSATTPTITNNNTFSIGADGVAAGVESAVAGGDRNGDGVPDRNQKNVSTFPWRNEAKFNQGASASSNDFVTLSIGDVSNSSSKNLDKNLKISTLGVIGTNDSYFSGVSFPSTATIGGSSQNVNAIYDPIFFKIEANGNSFDARDIDNSRAGTQIRLYFDMPDGGQNFDTYMKWNSVDEEWYEFKADGNLATYDDGAEFIDSDGDGDYDRVVLTITEGEKLGGDADGSSDNIIIDPGTIVSTSGLNYTGALSFNILEGNTDVAILTTAGATSYTLQTPAGYDHGLFTLNSSNGTLSFANAPDYETPQDVFGTAGDNTHMVQVLISDGSNSTVIDVEINVLDRWEFGQNNCPTLINKNPGGQLNNSWVYATSFTGITTTVNATGYIEFQFADVPSQEGLPKIVTAFVNGIADNLVEFDDPKVYAGSKSSDQYANSGLTRYVWHAQPSNNFSQANTFQLLFDNGGLLNITDLNSACGYSSSSSSPLNSISFTEGYVANNSECVGSNISFDITSATATNGGTITYQWQKLNTTTSVFDDLAGETNATLTFSSLVSGDAGTYRCLIKEVDGSAATIMAATSTEAVLTVTAGPTINFTSITLCAGSTSILSVTSNNTTGDSWGSSNVSVATVNSSGQVTGVGAGSATITYTDGSGCTVTSAITVNEVTTSISSNDPDNTICFGEAVTLTSDAAAGSHTFRWFKDGALVPSVTSQSLAVTTSGLYTVEVTNTANSCTATTDNANGISVTVNANPSITVVSSANIACNGATTGAIDINVTGGDGNFTYTWSDGASFSASSQDISNVGAGTYSINVVDGNSCSATSNITLTQPANALTATINSTSASAQGAADGSATVIVSGGTPNYTYLWNDSNNQTTATASNLTAGNYSVTITDANLCSITKSVSVSEPTSYSASISSSTNVSCNGGLDGSATVSVTGGVGPITFSWNTTPAQTNATATGLAAGNYLVTVTDANSVVTTANVNITEPTSLSISISVSDVACATDVTGGLDATVTGGTPNYTYAWSNGVSTDDQLGVGAGSYTLTATDGNGCIASQSATISVTDNTPPTVVTQDITVQLDASGSATITTGMINNGSTDDCAIDSYSLDITSFGCDDLGGNTVTLTVTDNNSNSSSATATVTVVDNIDPTITAPAAVTVNVDAGTCATALANVALGTPTTADNCSVASTTNNAPASFPLGNTTVTWTVTDGSGNTATATQVVTVVDNIDPTITAPAAVTVNVDAGTCATALANVALGTPTTADNCSVASTTNNAPASFPLGNTTVTWTVTDGSGNTATATQVVTVVDNIDPTITAPAAVTVNVDAGTCATALTNVTLGTPTTADNCSVASTSNNAPASFPLGNTTVTWTVTDGSGNTATATQVVTVVDNIDPTITAPAAVTVNVDAGTCATALANVALGTPTTADNCSVASTTNNAPASFPLGNTTVTWTVTDGSGNTATATQVVTVVDNIDPTITAPAAVTVNVDAGTCATALANVALGTPTTADNCSVASTTNNAPASFPLGNTTVTWTVTDGSGNTATATQVVTVVDNIDPTITAPAAVTVNVDAGTCATALANVALGTPTTADNCSVASTTNNAPASFPLGNTTVTWTVTDGSGNTATATQVVTVVDNIDPTITAPAAVTVNVDAGTCATALTNVTLGTPTTADNCTVASVTNDAPSSFPLGNTTVTWTVTDGSGNTATATQVVTVVDNIDPTITAPAAVTVNVDAGTCATALANVALGTPTTADNCSVASTTNNAPASFPLGNTTVTWTVTDGSGNTATATQVVTVVDNIDPTITAPAAVTVNVDAGTCATALANVALGTPTTADNCSVASTTNNAPASFPLGNTTVTWTVTDGSGNTATATQVVTVVDNIDPTITAPAAVTVNVDAGTCATALANVALGTPTTADNCSVASTTNNAPASFPLGNTTVTWTVTDGSGNTATATQVVTVVDNIDPTITAPAAVTVNVDAGTCATALANVALGTPTTADNCSVASTTNNAPASFPLGNTTVTWTVTDGSGNTATATQVVTVVDNIDPTITCPSDITAYADATTNGTTVTWAAPVTSDNCSISSVTSSIQSGTTFTLGTQSVTYTVVDGSGNSATCTFNVTVLDTVSPVITNCPSDITQNNDAGSCNAVVVWTAPTFFDNSGSYTVVWSHNSGDVFAVGTTTVTATVTDAAGNTTVCSFDVTVEDNEAPVVTAPSDVTVNADAGSCDAASSGVVIGTPTVSDNCGIASTTNNVPTAYTLGSNTVTWTVTDIHGNTTIVTQTVTVLDAEDPVITCPSDITAYAVADSTLTSVNWSAATATDNCSMDTIYSDIQIGAYLPLGATTVTYVAIDGSGNSDTCSFNITVVDTVSPVITGCPGPITKNNDTDSCGAVVSWTAPVYYDNSDYFTVTASHASGDYFPVGTTTVTITVADSAGNTSVCEFDVTVVDNQAPDVVPFNNVSITLGTDGMYTLTVPEVDSASYDNCGIANRYLSHTFFNCNDVPTATTWLVVEDIHGNKDSSLVTLSVSLPATPVLSITETLGDVLCYGDATGYAQLAVSGGVAPYSYNWSSGSTTFEATGLSLGSYWYEVTDTNGCYSTDTVAIGQPDSLYTTTVKSLYTGGYNVSINGASDGSITTTVIGGLTPYTFDWNTGAYSTQNLSGVPAGVYYLTLIDSNGCTFNIIDTLTEPTQLLVSATSLQSVICPDDTAGIAIAVASGAVPPYSYSWDFGSTTDYVSGLSYGIYTITVTDTNGAVASDTVLVDALDYDCDGIYNVDEGGTPNGGGGDGDIDGDGIPNEEDEDSDGDGLPDSEEFDYDNDGVGFDDCDGDGIPNFLDPDLCELLIPAVFTPNGDGDNDTWEILGIHAFPDNNVQVFNRWGELVYFKEGYDNEFNGRANSRTQMNGGDGLLPTGTYYYIVKVYETGDTYTGYVYITK